MSASEEKNSAITPRELKSECVCVCALCTSALVYTCIVHTYVMALILYFYYSRHCVSERKQGKSVININIRVIGP